MSRERKYFIAAGLCCIVGLLGGLVSFAWLLCLHRPGPAIVAGFIATISCYVGEIIAGVLKDYPRL